MLQGREGRLLVLDTEVPPTDTRQEMVPFVVLYHQKVASHSVSDLSAGGRH